MSDRLANGHLINLYHVEAGSAVLTCARDSRLFFRLVRKVAYLEIIQGMAVSLMRAWRLDFYDSRIHVHQLKGQQFAPCCICEYERYGV